MTWACHVPRGVSLMCSLKTTGARCFVQCFKDLPRASLGIVGVVGAGMGIKRCANVTAARRFSPHCHEPCWRLSVTSVRAESLAHPWYMIQGAFATSADPLCASYRLLRRPSEQLRRHARRHPAHR